MWNPFQVLLPKRFLGIDIGTSFVKMVEVSRFGHRKKLENYGSLSAEVFYKKPFRTFEKSTILFSTDDIARAIMAINEEAKTKARQAVFSIPDFSTFFTNFELPLMSPEEIPQAVRYEARQHIPLPLAEVTPDWQLIDDKPLSPQKTNLKILLVAVPNEVVNQYQKIAQVAQLELVALEAEVFALIRSLIQEEEKGVLALIDIGAQSTTCSIVEKRILKMSRSFDMSGNDLTMAVSKSLNLDFLEAQKLKEKCGIRGFDLALGEQSKVIKEILIPLVDTIIREIEKTISGFSQQDGKDIERVVLTGGTALIPGLREYFEEQLKKETVVPNPFANLFYPPILEKKLEEMGPSFSIATGLALRGLED